MRRALIWLAVVVLSALAVGAAVGRTSTPLTAPGVHGYDVSWPQCSGATARDMPGGSPSYLVLGLTDGSGHTVNPCLGSQLAWASSHGSRVGAYLVASYPSRVERTLAATGIFGRCDTSQICRLRNDGAAQAADAVETMHEVGLRAPRVWIDVEFRHAFAWSRSQRDNAAVLQGIVAGLRRAHLPMGVYSTSLMWDDIAGSYRLDVPNWLPSGDGKPGHAAAMCTATASGGATWLVQYTRSLDSDLTCPVLDAVPGHHGKLWRFRRSTEELFSKGPAVRALQHVVGAAINGSYGALTTIAVSSWQLSKGLAVTGRITPVDWRAMGADRIRGGHGFWLSRIAGPA